MCVCVFVRTCVCLHAGECICACVFSRTRHACKRSIACCHHSLYPLSSHPFSRFLSLLLAFPPICSCHRPSRRLHSLCLTRATRNRAPAHMARKNTCAHTFSLITAHTHPHNRTHITAHVCAHVFLRAPCVHALDCELPSFPLLLPALPLASSAVLLPPLPFAPVTDPPVASASSAFLSRKHVRRDTLTEIFDVIRWRK